MPEVGIVITFISINVEKIAKDNVKRALMINQSVKHLQELMQKLHINNTAVPYIKLKQRDNGGINSAAVEILGFGEINENTSFVRAFKESISTEILYFLRAHQNDLDITFKFCKEKVHNEQQVTSGSGDEELDFEKKAAHYIAKDPLYPFEQLILPQSLIDEIETAIDTIRFEGEIFDLWGLRKIQPFARSALNFYGPSGTGKTMAAHAIASKLHKNILVASYADIESKYHGEGPKNVEAIFLSAQNQNAILFIDEADSMLSKRLLNVTQGSEQAINSMRSQLLICLEKFSGIVIFATNLVKNYDYAFETRMTSINFVLPDYETRKKIWKVHLLPTIPLAEDVNVAELAQVYEGFCGRDIREAVVKSCVHARRQGKDCLSHEDLLFQSARIQDNRLKLTEAKDDTAGHQNQSPKPEENKTKAALANLIEDGVKKYQTENR